MIAGGLSGVDCGEVWRGGERTQHLGKRDPKGGCGAHSGVCFVFVLVVLLN